MTLMNERSWEFMVAERFRAVASAVEAEREACAKVIESFDFQTDTTRAMAATIRARSKPKTEAPAQAGASPTEHEGRGDRRSPNPAPSDSGPSESANLKIADSGKPNDSGHGIGDLAKTEEPK